MNTEKLIQFGQDYLHELAVLFRPQQDDKQPLMKKIVIYSIVLLIGILCTIGMLFNGYEIGVPGMLIPMAGMLCILGKDVMRYLNGEKIAKTSEMGKKLVSWDSWLSWVRWLITALGIIVITFAILLLGASF